MARFDRDVVLALASCAIVGCSVQPEPLGSNSQAASVVAGQQGATIAERAKLRDPNVATRLRSLALGVSASRGIVSPATMRAVAASDHSAAESVICGASLPDHGPVYLVQMAGGPFVAPGASSQGMQPTGKVLTVTLDAATYRVTDIGYDDAPHDLTEVDSDVVDLM